MDQNIDACIKDAHDISKRMYRSPKKGRRAHARAASRKIKEVYNTLNGENTADLSMWDRDQHALYETLVELKVTVDAALEELFKKYLVVEAVVIVIAA